MNLISSLNTPVFGAYCYRFIEINERAFLGIWKTDYFFAIQFLFMNFTIMGNMSWLAPPMNAPKYRVAWKDTETNKTGHGNWCADKNNIQEWVDHGNKTHPNVCHWIEEKHSKK